MDYEEQARKDDPTFDIYYHLQTELGEGYSEPTVRKWVNINIPDLPKINQLTTISKHVKNRHALDIAIQYLLKQAEGLN